MNHFTAELKKSQKKMQKRTQKNLQNPPKKLTKPTQKEAKRHQVYELASPPCIMVIHTRNTIFLRWHTHECLTRKLQAVRGTTAPIGEKAERGQGAGEGGEEKGDTNDRRATGGL